MLRAKLVPALVLLLSLVAIAAIAVLQSRAQAGSEAQLALARTETSLNALQTAPFRAARSTGGSPLIARALINRGERAITNALAGLDASAPPAALRRLPAQLGANYATLETIYAIGVLGSYDARADRLSAMAARQVDGIKRDLASAGGVYNARADSNESRATFGSAAVILLLVAGFGFLYRRSSRARTTAERLVTENHRLLAASRQEALTDALTGLPNRRALVRELEAAFGPEHAGEDHVLALLDLDGFKLYNDTFGHPAGDALLARLGVRLADAVSGLGMAFRMGGDEFCVLGRAGADGGTVLVGLAAQALSERGEAFDIDCSFGMARIHGEAATVEYALRLADQRMYEQKVGRVSSARQSTEVLLTVLSEHSPALHDHLSQVAELAEAMARAHGLPEPEVEWIRIAAELHDVGKVAIPDAILNKSTALDEAEWAFMHRHTTIGERIIQSAPSLAPAAKLVRSSHERYDGRGYPDGLRGAEIEVGASIIAICDAYDAMVSDRLYRVRRSHAEALAELRHCAGTQFDPDLVEVFCTSVERRTDVESGLMVAAP